MLRTLRFGLVWFLFVSLSVRGEDGSGSKGLAIGPPAGARSEYEVMWRVEALGRERQHVLGVVLYRLTGESKNRVVAVVTEPAGEQPGTVTQPLQIIRVDKENRPDRHGGRASLLTQLVSPALFTSFAPPRIEVGVRWMAKERQGEVRHEIRATENEGRLLEIRSEVAKDAEPPPDRETLGALSVLKSWSRSLVFDPKERRPLSVTTVKLTELYHGTEKEDHKHSIEVRELKNAPLTDRELEAVAAELPKLEELLKAADESRRGASGTVVRSTIGEDGKQKVEVVEAQRAKKRPQAADPFELIDAYQREFPDGLLTSSVKRFRDQLEGQQKMLDRQLMLRRVGRALVNVPAPEFSLSDLSGKKVSLKDFDGKVVALNFFGVNCPPCRVEAPFLSQLQEKYRDKGLVVLAVNGFEGESKELIERYVTDQGLKQKVLLEGREVAKDRYRVHVFPTTFIIDRTGKIVDRSDGFAEFRKERTEKKIQSVLANGHDAP